MLFSSYNHLVTWDLPCSKPGCISDSGRFLIDCNDYACSAPVVTTVLLLLPHIQSTRQPLASSNFQLVE